MKTLVFKAGKKTLFKIPISCKQCEFLKARAEGEGVGVDALLISLIRKVIQGFGKD